MISTPVEFGSAWIRRDVLDTIGDDKLTLYYVRHRLFPMDKNGSADLAEGVLWRLVGAEMLEAEQDAKGEHWRFWRPNG
ncbi:hypothetical protein [Candidatus Poriferisodalis sp.]|uniref:hypothetical protein n=1 Tax=Candidatus Poriferisodalis sp. TaxID=3101277 RepID=UPI003B0217A9